MDVPAIPITKVEFYAALEEAFAAAEEYFVNWYTTRSVAARPLLVEDVKEFFDDGWFAAFNGICAAEARVKFKRLLRQQGYGVGKDAPLDWLSE